MVQSDQRQIWDWDPGQETPSVVVWRGLWSWAGLAMSESQPCELGQQS